MSNYTPEHLKLWTRPECYIGESWPATYSAGVGQSRDSDALEQSNFACMLAALGGESETVTVVRESHWAVGWVKWIAIHQDDETALRTADEIVAALADYPVVDDDHYSTLEYEEVCESWERASIRDRVAIIKRAGNGVSIFAARHPFLPQDDDGAIYEYLRD